MKLTIVLRILCAAAVLGSVSTFRAAAASVRHAGPMVHTYRLVHAGEHGASRPNFSCPPSYFECLSLTRSSPFTATWCISSTGNCTSGLVGNWYWTAVVGKVGHSRAFRRVHATWSPDPGNPSTLTITDNRTESDGTKIVATVTLSTCNTSSGTCFSDFVVYAITN